MVSVSVRYLFYQPMDEKIKTWTLRFAAKENPNMEKALGPFIRGKIRRELYHLYEHVLSKTRTADINGSRLISVFDSFSRECCP